LDIGIPFYISSDCFYLGKAHSLNYAGPDLRILGHVGRSVFGLAASYVAVSPMWRDFRSAVRALSSLPASQVER
jgi:hypothetical protein